jgi:probable rRNA maturation factor
VIFVEVNGEYRDLIPDEILKEAAQKALQIDCLEDMPSLSIKITGDQVMQDLNASYRGIDKTTDVLSFQADYFDPDLGSRYLGDVVISYPQAAEQAEKRAHPVSSELQLLVIHGVLHLLGYDHGTAQEKESMWKVQKQALDALGLDIMVEDGDSH